MKIFWVLGDGIFCYCRNLPNCGDNQLQISAKGFPTTKTSCKCFQKFWQFICNLGWHFCYMHIQNWSWCWIWNVKVDFENCAAFHLGRLLLRPYLLLPNLFQHCLSLSLKVVILNDDLIQKQIWNLKPILILNNVAQAFCIFIIGRRL